MARFLDQDGLQYFAERLAELIKQKTQISMVSTIDEDSTNQQIPGAKAVYEFLTSALENITGFSFEVVSDLPATGESNVIYLIDNGSGAYTMNAYVNGAWIELGTTEIDLSNYWAKDDLQPLTKEEIQDIIDDVMGD